jgi:hypothetical protein
MTDGTSPMTRALAVALGLMVSIAALPADAVRSLGLGSSPCGNWTADRTARGVYAAAEEQWVVGYLSGVAVWAQDLDPLKGLDAPAVWAWMDNYCRAHPLAMIINAVDAFVREHPGH